MCLWGTQVWNFNFVKKILNGMINGSTLEKIDPHANHFNEQLVIELVFYNFFHIKKAGGY